MRITHHSRSVVVVLIIGLCTSPLARVAAQDRGLVRPLAGQRTRVLDVALSPHGTLSGQIVDSAGLPLANQPILAARVNEQPLEVTSNEQGRFSIVGMRGGLYQLSAGGAAVACRCWLAGTAPPAAGTQVLLVAEEDIQRGQRPIADLIAGPVLIGLIIAAAIAIPIAVHNSQDDAS